MSIRENLLGWNSNNYSRNFELRTISSITVAICARDELQYTQGKRITSFVVT
jgi:hypothetical protein